MSHKDVLGLPVVEPKERPTDVLCGFARMSHKDILGMHTPVPKVCPRDVPRTYTGLKRDDFGTSAHPQHDILGTFLGRLCVDWDHVWSKK